MAAREIGIFSLPVAIAPGELLPLHVFEERYKTLIGDCLRDDSPFLLLFKDEQGARELGCTARVIEVLARHDDGRMEIVVEGEELLRVVELTRGQAYSTALVEPVDDDLAAERERDAALELYRAFAEGSGMDTRDDHIQELDSPLSYAILARIDVPPAEKQNVLELRSERERLMAVTELLARGLQGLKQMGEIRARAQTNGRVPLG